MANTKPSNTAAKSLHTSVSKATTKWEAPRQTWRNQGTPKKLMLMDAVHVQLKAAANTAEQQQQKQPDFIGPSIAIAEEILAAEAAMRRAKDEAKRKTLLEMLFEQIRRHIGRASRPSPSRASSGSRPGPARDANDKDSDPSADTTSNNDSYSHYAYAGRGTNRGAGQDAGHNAGGHNPGNNAGSSNDSSSAKEQANAPDHYATLGIDRNASPAEVRKAYFKAALKNHPDKNPGDETAKEKMQAVTEANETLSDPAKRAEYDRANPDAGKGSDNSASSAKSSAPRPPGG